MVNTLEIFLSCRLERRKQSPLRASGKICRHQSAAGFWARSPKHLWYPCARMDDNDLLRVIDMHGQFTGWADEKERRRLRQMGYAVERGTKRKIHELRLVVPLAIAAEVPIGSSRELAGIPRDRYLFRDDIEYRLPNGESRHAPGFRLKPIARWQRRFFGPMTPRKAYRRPAEKQRKKSR
jgi:hypothetical protein